MGNVEKVVNEINNTYAIKRYMPGSQLWIHHYSSSGALTSVEKQTLLKDHLGSINVIMDHNDTIDQLLSSTICYLTAVFCYLSSAI